MIFNITVVRTVVDQYIVGVDVCMVICHSIDSRDVLPTMDLEWDVFQLSLKKFYW